MGLTKLQTENCETIAIGQNVSHKTTLMAKITRSGCIRKFIGSYVKAFILEFKSKVFFFNEFANLKKLQIR